MKTDLPYLELVRPANVVTAVADGLAGFAVAGFAEPRTLPLLLVSTALLYAGGVTLNDVFDAGLDKEERPERPIPSGRVSISRGAWFGGLLLAAGVGAAGLRSVESGVIAVAIAMLVLMYDAWGKRESWGPINMAACRAFNLLLGMSAAPGMVRHLWYLALIPFLYIAAITVLSKGEVHGGSRSVSAFSLVCIGCVIAGLLALGGLPQFRLAAAAVFIAFFAWRVIPAFWRSLATPGPTAIRGAVRAGVLSLIVLDSAIAAGFAGVLYGALVLSLSFAAGSLARLFAVT